MPAHLLTRHAAGVSAAVLAAAFLLTACNGDDDDAAKKAAAQASSLASAVAAGAGTAAPGSSGPGQTRTIGKTGWWSGFAITVDKAALTPAGELTLDVTYKNLGDQNAEPPGDGFIQAGGAVTEVRADSSTVAGSSSATGKITATLKDAADPAKALDSAVLTYGKAGDNQTKIPLSKDGTVTSTEPKNLAVTGKASQGQLNFELVNGTLNPSYKSGEKDKSLLNLKIKISCAPDCQAQGHNTGRAEFAVKAPDGSTVVADARSPYCCDAIYPGTVSNDIKNILVFVVTSPGTGKYTLTYDNKRLSGAGKAPAVIEFTA